jgi:alkaline phosphatase D
VTGDRSPIGYNHKVRETTPTPRPLSRRQFLALSATVVVGACSGSDSGSDDTDDADTTATTGATGPATTPAAPTTQPASTTSAVTAPPTMTPATTTTTSGPPVEPLAGDPFVFGVASGDPDATGVVLWTRLGGDLPDDVPVTWELLDGDTVVASGTERATPEHAHTVHAVVPLDGPLDYRFTAGGFTSPLGHTQPATDRDELRIASASCQHFETGFYAAHRDLAEWQPDLVLFVGDFIYEGGTRPVGGEVVRSHDGPEPTDLESYRTRYAQYLGDADLQAARATCPWIAIWDDHEVENNYAGLTPQNPDDAPTFATRRAAAYQAWWEHTPTRLAAPDGEQPYAIYRGVEYGSLAAVNVLDGRQFRSVQACGNPVLSLDPPCPEVFDEARTMLGAEQEAWIADRFAASTATWNVLGQQTVLSDVRFGDAILNYDQWDGYPAARQRLLAGAPSDLIVITGDIHLAGVGTLGGAGVEFITTAISSTADIEPDFGEIVRNLGEIFDAELVFRGYTRHTVTPARWTAEYRSVTDVADPASAVTTWKSFTVDHGSGVPVAA